MTTYLQITVLSISSPPLSLVRTHTDILFSPVLTVNSPFLQDYSWYCLGGRPTWAWLQEPVPEVVELMPMKAVKPGLDQPCVNVKKGMVILCQIVLAKQTLLKRLSPAKPEKFQVSSPLGKMGDSYLLLLTAGQTFSHVKYGPVNAYIIYHR